MVDQRKKRILDYLHRKGVKYTIVPINIVPFKYEMEFDWQDDLERIKFNDFLEESGIIHDWIPCSENDI
jgi:hypothetical protein